jgi:hypothetical protein
VAWRWRISSASELLDLSFTVAHRLFPALEGFDLAIEVLFLLREALFDTRGFGAALFEFGFERIAEGESFLFRLEQELFLTSFGLSEDPAGLLLCLLQ